MESNEIQTIKGDLLSKITLNGEEWEGRGRTGRVGRGAEEDGFAFPE